MSVTEYAATHGGCKHRSNRLGGLLKVPPMSFPTFKIVALGKIQRSIPVFPKIITTFISCRFSRNSTQRFPEIRRWFPDKRPSLRVEPSAASDLVGHGADSVNLSRADGGIEVMFNSGDNVAGLDAFTFSGVEVAGQHIAFDPV